MQKSSLPAVDARYWAAIVAASMCGANTGDFAAHYLHLGHAYGLLPMAAIFLGILWAERRSAGGLELYYWLAIIVLRTAATNLADLGTHDLKLGFPAVIAGLAALMALILLIDRSRDSSPPTSAPTRVTLPATDLPYWIVMLAAGTLGTALGDFVADELGLGAGYGSLALAPVFGLTLWIASVYGRMTKPWYWLAIVAARTLGTTLGDFAAGRKGLALGLPLSTLCTGLLLVAILVLWNRLGAGRLKPA